MFILTWLGRLLYGSEVLKKTEPKSSPKRVKPRKTRRK